MLNTLIQNRKGKVPFGQRKGNKIIGYMSRPNSRTHMAHLKDGENTNYNIFIILIGDPKSRWDIYNSNIIY